METNRVPSGDLNVFIQMTLPKLLPEEMGMGKTGSLGPVLQEYPPELKREIYEHIYL